MVDLVLREFCHWQEIVKQLKRQSVNSQSERLQDPCATNGQLSNDPVRQGPTLQQEEDSIFYHLGSLMRISS